MQKLLWKLAHQWCVRSIHSLPRAIGRALLSPAVQPQAGRSRRRAADAINRVLRHLAIRGPLTAGDGDQFRWRDEYGVIAGNGGGARSIGAPHERPLSRPHAK